jgi:hypothetical protein
MCPEGKPGSDVTAEQANEEIEALPTEIARRFGFRVVHRRLELRALPFGEEGGGTP